MTTGLMITPKHTKPKLVKYTFKDLERIAFKVDIGLGCCGIRCSLHLLKNIAI